MDEDYREYAPADRPDVLIEVDGVWLPGELHAWAKRGGEWWAHVSWRQGVAQQRRGTVAAERVRAVEG